jgi:hypothetical protein
MWWNAAIHVTRSVMVLTQDHGPRTIHRQTYSSLAAPNSRTYRRSKHWRDIVHCHPSRLTRAAVHLGRELRALGMGVPFAMSILVLYIHRLTVYKVVISLLS